MLCRADLGSGRVTGELIRRNEQTILIRLIKSPLKEKSGIYVPERKKGKLIKRHIVKHRVTFQEEDEKITASASAQRA